MEFDIDKVAAEAADRTEQHNLEHSLEGLWQSFPFMEESYKGFTSLAIEMDERSPQAAGVARDAVNAKLRDAIDAWDGICSMIETEGHWNDLWPRNHPRHWASDDPVSPASPVQHFQQLHFADVDQMCEYLAYRPEVDPEQLEEKRKVIVSVTDFVEVACEELSIQLNPNPES